MASIMKRGDKWRASVVVQGLRDTATFENKAKAKEWGAIRELELKKLAGGTSTTHTLKDVFDRYAREVSPKKKGSRWEIIRLTKLSKHPIANIKLIDLTAEHLQEWVEKRGQEVKSSSVNREMNLISHALNSAKRWKWLKVSPTKDVVRPRNPEHRERRVTEDEIKKLCFCLNYEPGAEVTQKQQKVALALLFAIETGMRAGEICSLTPESIRGRVAHLPNTKNGRSRDVPLSSAAENILKQLPETAAGEKLFDLTPATLSQFFRKAKARAGIDDLTFHDSRHEAITRLASKLDVLDLARMVGHRDIRQLMIYYNKSASDLVAQLG